MCICACNVQGEHINTINGLMALMQTNAILGKVLGCITLHLVRWNQCENSKVIEAQGKSGKGTHHMVHASFSQKMLHQGANVTMEIDIKDFHADCHGIHFAATQLLPHSQ